MTYANHREFDRHENVRVFRDPQNGLVAVIAVHSTYRGPGAGGCRFWSYPNEDAAVTDALRLSRAMSYKNAMADLPLGGGKTAIVAPQGEVDRVALFEAFGRAVHSLAGQYITAEDVGTTPADMVAASRYTSFVSGLPVADGAAGGNPAPWTAKGVFDAIAETLRHKGRTIASVSVAVQGVGNVGSRLAELLRAADADLVVCDANEERAAEVAKRVSAAIVAPDDIYEQDVDVFAPCALGGVFDDVNIARLKARVLVGAANNQLATDDHALVLHEKGFDYVPDYVVNAGGIICCAGEYLGWSVDEISRRVDAIGPRVKTLIARSEAERVPPSVVAARVAAQRIGRNEAAAAKSAAE